MPGRHRHPVLGDEEARDGQDESREGPVPILVHPLEPDQQRDDQLLPADHQVDRAHPPESHEPDERDLPENPGPQTCPEGEDLAGEEGGRKTGELQRHEERLDPLHDQRIRRSAASLTSPSLKWLVLLSAKKIQSQKQASLVQN